MRFRENRRAVVEHVRQRDAFRNTRAFAHRAKQSCIESVATAVVRKVNVSVPINPRIDDVSAHVLEFQIIEAGNGSIGSTVQAFHEEEEFRWREIPVTGAFVAAAVFRIGVVVMIDGRHEKPHIRVKARWIIRENRVGCPQKIGANPRRPIVRATAPAEARKIAFRLNQQPPSDFRFDSRDEIRRDCRQFVAHDFHNHRQKDACFGGKKINDFVFDRR